MNLRAWVLVAIGVLVSPAARPCVPALEWACGWTAEGEWMCNLDAGKAAAVAGRPVLQFGHGDGDTLRLTRGFGPGAEFIWERKIDVTISGFASPDGHYVVLVRGFLRQPGDGGPNLWLIGPKGQELRAWDMLSLLSEEERLYLPYTSCGRQWFANGGFEGSTFEFRVKQGAAPPMVPQVTLAAELDPVKQKLSRGAAVKRPSIEEAIAGYRAAETPQQRSGWLNPLMVKSRMRAHKGHQGLRRFWLELARSEPTVFQQHRAAVAALMEVGTLADLEALQELVPASDELNLGLLDAWKQRDPERALAYARAALKERFPPVLLRSRALNLLLKAGGEQADRALAAAATDPAAEVREAARREGERRQRERDRAAEQAARKAAAKAKAELPPEHQALVAATIEVGCSMHQPVADRKAHAAAILKRHGFDQASFDRLSRKLGNDPRVRLKITSGLMRCIPRRRGR